MTPEQILFLITGAVTLVAALMVVTSPNLVHAGLWLILALAGIAVLFITLGSGFLAVVQVAIYIDAIAILIIITVMLTRRVMRQDRAQMNRNWVLAMFSSLLVFGALTALLFQAPSMDAVRPQEIADQGQILEDLGRALVDVNQFVLPFEVASVLLVAALIGAIVVAMVPLIRSRGEVEE